MYAVQRRALAAMLAVTMVGTVLAPAAVQAASPRSHPLVQWAEVRLDRTVERGHEAVAIAHFRTTRTITHVVFSLRFDGAAYARPATFSWGTILPDRWYSLPFVVGVPAAATRSTYVGYVRLDRWSGPHDIDRVGAALPVTIRVPTATLLAWTPAVMGTIQVQQGQTLTENASFVSNKALSGVQIKSELNAYAVDHGLAIGVASPLPASVAAGVAYQVSFTVAAAANTPTGVYAAALYLLGSDNGGAAIRLWHELGFNVRVVTSAPVIKWTPANLGTLTLLQGQTVTESGTFVSNIPVSAVQLQRSLANDGAGRGVAITLLSMTPSTAVLAPNTPYTMTFTVSAAPTATVGVYPAIVYLTGSVNGAAPTTLHYGLHFAVDVDRVSPLASWIPGSPASYLSITRNSAATVAVTETAALSANMALTNASISGNLNGSAVAQGFTLTPVAISGGAVAANTPVTVSFVIGVPATARPGIYSGNLWLNGQATGAAAPARLGHALYFVFAVN